MRNLTWFLTLVVGAVVFGFVLMPILGVVLLVILGVVLLVGALILLAPLLMRLPWFRDRIHVEQTGYGRTIRFGSSAFTAYRSASPLRGRSDDVIDVVGRELPDGEDDVIDVAERELPEGEDDRNE